MTQAKKFYSLYFTILLLFILNFLLFESNESSIFATAYHYVDSSWIQGDWWLSTGIEYGSLFNIFAGALYKYTNYLTTFLVGKLFVYVLWSFILTSLLQSFRISLFIVPLMVCFIQKNQSLGFGEWMYTGFETKAFAYLAFMTSLFMLAKSRFKTSFFLLGLSVSFHVLVGLYLSLAVFFVLFIDKTLSNKLNFKKLDFFKYGPLFLIGASAGILAIIKWKLAGQSVDPSIVQQGAVIYATKRVSHHVLYHWSFYSTAFILSFFSLSYLYKKKYQKSLFARLLIGVTATTLLYFILGVFISFAGLTHYLKFYFFRTPDVLVPFTTTLLLFSILSLYLEKKDKTKIITTVFMALFIAGFARSFYKCYKGSVLFNEKREDQNDSAYQWIKNNTAKTDTFLVEANNQYFYIYAERPIFVAFKHSPQKEKHIVEWYRRLTVLNGGTEPSGSSWDLPLNINENFKKLDPEYLRKNMKDYGLKYLFVKKKIHFDLPLVYSSERYNIYSP